MFGTHQSVRRVRLAATGLAMAVTLVGCGSSPTPATPATPAASDQPTTPVATKGDPAVVDLVPKAVADKGQLVVATEAQYPPFEFYDEDNKTIIGADAEMATAVAEKMGLEVSLVDAAFDTIIPSLASKRYDMAESAFTVTAERIEQVDFVTYYYEGDGALVKSGNPKGLGVDDSLCGVKVAVLKGSTQDAVSVPRLNKMCTDAGKSELAVSILPGSNGLGLALSSGRVDAVLTDGSNAAFTAKQSGGKMELAPGDPFNPAPFGIATVKDSGMAEAVQAALKSMIADGSYLEILTNWGMQAGAVETPEINEVTS